MSRWRGVAAGFAIAIALLVCIGLLGQGITGGGSGGGGVWGTITGTLSGQTDLWNALNGKQAALSFPAPGTSATLSGPSAIYVCTGACTITVPAPAAGVQYCVMNDDNVATAITLSAIGSSAMYENQARTGYGTAGTGTLVSGGAVKDAVCLVGRDATHYLFVSSQGTWTAN